VGRAGHWDNTCVVEENAWSKRTRGRRGRKGFRDLKRGLEEELKRENRVSRVNVKL